MPPRSPLYALVPCGVGSAEMESFTSYLHRLAWAYRTTVNTLMRLVAAREELASLHLRFSTAPWRYGKTEAMILNGSETSARLWIEGLQILTRQADLHCLTLGGWAGSLSTRNALRKEIAWCPSCYNDWRDRQQPIYQPLLWMLDSTTMCVRHRQYLVGHCGNPACGRSQHVLQSRLTAPGVCRWCGTWLGEIPSEHGQDEREWEWNQWLYQVADELATLPQETHRWNTVLQNMRSIAEHAGGPAALTKRLGMSPRVWYPRFSGYADYIPPFMYVLQFAFVLGRTPKELMGESAGQEMPPFRANRWGDLKRGFRQRKSCKEINRIRADVEQFVQECLEDKRQWVSVSHLAKFYGITTHCIMRWVPSEVAELRRRRKIAMAREFDERKAIVRREAEALLRAAKKEGRVVGCATMAAQVSYPGILNDSRSGRALWHELREQITLLPANDL